MELIRSVCTVIYDKILNTVKLKGFHYKYKQNFSKAFFGLQEEVAALVTHGIIPTQTRWPPAGRGCCASMAHILQHRNSLFYFGCFLSNHTATAVMRWLSCHLTLKNPIIDVSCKTEVELISC